MYIGLRLVGVDQREDNLICHLIQDACNTQDKDGPRIADHLLEQPSVEKEINTEQVWKEEEGDKTCAEQVDEEDIEDGSLA